MDFSSFQLSSALSEALVREKFTEPTPVQREAIPAALAGHDVLASAQTGSGKTAAFVLPILQHLLEPADGRRRGRPQPGTPKALILAPTRELAGQIAEVVGTFSRGTPLSHAVIFGGVNKKPQITALRRGIDIAIATPGRLLDLMGEGVLSLTGVDTVVLDEADRMLDMGFIPDVRRIMSALPHKRQSLFFSATMPTEVERLAGEILNKPVRVSMEKEASAAPDIAQHMLFVDRQQKRDALRMLLTEHPSYRAIVFTRTKFKARDVARHLNKHGITADDLHGNKSQNARQRALANFHSGKIHVLVATDIASRGIDVDDIDQVINFELPNEPESYVHRIGRTARAGRSGSAFSLCDDTEVKNLQDIQKEIGATIEVMEDHPFHAAAIATSALPRPGGSRGGSGGARRNSNAGGGGNRSSGGNRNRRRRPQGSGADDGNGRSGRPSGPDRSGRGGRPGRAAQSGRGGRG